MVLQILAGYLIVRRRSASSEAQSSIDRAIDASDRLIEAMKNAKRDPVLGIVMNLLQHRHNTPYVTTVYQADAEMKSAMDAKRLNGSSPD